MLEELSQRGGHFRAETDLSFPTLEVSTERAAPQAPRSFLQEEFPTRPRLALPKELLPPLRPYLCVPPPRVKWGLPPTFLILTDTEFWCRRQEGGTSSSLQPTSQQQLCTLHGRTIPRPEQTTWVALMTRNVLFLGRGLSLMLYNSIIWSSFHPLEWQLPFIPHTRPCRMQEGVWALFQVKWRTNKALLNGGRGGQRDLFIILKEHFTTVCVVWILGK